MQFRTLGTDLRVSAVAMGCMSLALTDGPTYRAIEEQQALATVDAAIEAGINFFDTAPAYGDGESDRVLGRALQGRRDQAVIATKCSGPTLSRQEIVTELEQSLHNLRTDRVDLLQIHWPRRKVPIDETMRALEDLRASGKVRMIGVCNFGPLDLIELLEKHTIVSNQLPYSLLLRAVEHEVRDICVERGIGILCYSPLAQGLLAGRFTSADEVPVERQRTRHFAGTRPQARHGEAGHEAETFAAIARIRAIADGMGVAMADLAAAWLLHQPGVTAVLTGASSPEQIRQNARPADLKLSPDVLRQLDEATAALKQAMGPNIDPWQPVSASRIR